MAQQPQTLPVRQTKFNNGEISPTMYGDISHPKFSASLRTCKNWLPIPQGALVNRPGFKYVAEVKYPYYGQRLIPFVFSDNLAYLLEFGQGYVRFYQNGSQVLVGGTWAAFDALVTYARGTVVSYSGSFWVSASNGNLGNAPTGVGPWAGPFLATDPYEIQTEYFGVALPYLKYAQVGNTVTICFGGQVPNQPAVTATAPQDLVYTPSAVVPTWSLSPTPLKIPDGAVNFVGAPPISNIKPFNLLTLYRQGDQVTYNGAQWMAIQDNFVGILALPPATALNAAQTGLSGNLYWTPSIDAGHQAVAAQWAQTAVVQNKATGATYESAMSPSLALTTPVAFDRKTSIQALVPGTGLAGEFALDPGYTFLYSKMYRATDGGLFGWLSDFTGSAYIDDGRAADYGTQPPKGTDPFLINGADSYPAVVGYMDQRRLFASSVLVPQGIALSRDGDFADWDRPNPGVDTDSLLITIGGEKLEQVRAFKSMRRGVVMSGQSEWTLSGPGGAPVSKTGRELKWQSGWGSGWLDPIKIGTGILFGTAKSNMVRDFYPLYGLYSDIWDGQELSFMARHMFDLFTITDWAFQSVPYPLVWSVRSDGAFLSITYQHATTSSFGQQLGEGVCAWATHSTGGAQVDSLLSICVVPEPPDDAVYAVVKRTVLGVEKRYVERMNNPVCPASPYVAGVQDPRYGIYLDSAVVQDGHATPVSLGKLASISNPGSTNPADFTSGTLVQVLSALSSIRFTQVDADNNAVFIFDPDGLGVGPAEVKITAYNSPTDVYGEVRKDLTQAQVTACVVLGVYCGIARNKISLAHLNGYALDTQDANLARGIAALADGNPAAATSFVGGVLTLQTPALVICAGLSYNADVALLDAHHGNADVRNREKRLIKIGFETAGGRGLWLGSDFDKLWEWEQRKVADGYANVPLAVGYYEQEVTDTWNKGGRAAVRQIDPLPMSITATLREFALGGT